MNMKSSLLTSPPLGSPAVNGYGELYTASPPPDTQMEGISIGSISIGSKDTEIDEVPHTDSAPFHQLWKDYDDRIHTQS